jgi:hypothetical protein
MIRTLLVATLILACGLSAEAKKKAKVVVNKEKIVVSKEKEGETSFTPKKGRLGTDFAFSGSAVDGKYLSAGDSIAEVEDEKSLGALIGIRKNFRDKLDTERARLKSEGK